MHLTVGTAFTITIFTSTVSVMTHHKNKLVDFSVVKTFGIFVVIGVLLGTVFASVMKTKILVLFFSVVVYFFGAYLMLAQEKIKKIKPNPSLFPRVIFGVISGFISAPMGITGAMMNVPILRYLGYPISKCIGSAAAIGFIIALFGTIGFLFSGNYLNANLPLSIGFLNIPAFLIFFPISAFMARLGAKASHRINKKKMTKYFGIFLIVIGSKFLFEYFNL